MIQKNKTWGYLRPWRTTPGNTAIACADLMRKRGKRADARVMFSSDAGSSNVTP
jgi:hypothetical protein